MTANSLTLSSCAHGNKGTMSWVTSDWDKESNQTTTQMTLGNTLRYNKYSGLHNIRVDHSSNGRFVCIATNFKSTHY